MKLSQMTFTVRVETAMTDTQLDPVVEKIGEMYDEFQQKLADFARANITGQVSVDMKM